MPFIAYSETDPISMETAGFIRNEFGFEYKGRLNGFEHYRFENIDMIGIDSALVEADFLDAQLNTDLIIFLSMHKSSAGIKSLTVHSEGNWSNENKLGGRPRELSFAAPVEMFSILKYMGQLNYGGTDVVYEATHHGPFLKTPSLFAEFGGNARGLPEKEGSGAVAKAVMHCLLDKNDGENFDKIAIGIGGTHYSKRFAKLAFEGKYAFSHIMPKYFLNEYMMLEQASLRSNRAPEIAVMEWKSINKEVRDRIISRLNDIGMDYEKI